MTVKGYVEQIEVVADGQVVARHARRYDQGQRVLDPLHYLNTLGQKPAALDHAPVYRDWQLPPAFAELRRTLEQRLGGRTGARHYIRVLQLLARHSLARVEQALLRCRAHAAVDAAVVQDEVERLARVGEPSSDMAMSLGAPTLSGLQIPLPDLTQFNRLLSSSLQGVAADDPSHRVAAEDEPEAVEAADHVGRVGATGP